jgi:tRNA(fMet)-specific endonuclease VapC
MRYLLDTNICIYVINARPALVLERFRQEPVGQIGVSSVSAAELAYGVNKGGSSRNEEALRLFLAPLTIVPFDEDVIWTYGKIRTDLEKRGMPIGAMDTMIAAHALSMNLTLVTNNVREFERVQGLRLENWAQPHPTLTPPDKA